MSEVVEVRLVGVPVATSQQAAAHFDGLVREFSLLDAGSDAPPARLVEIREALRDRFGAFTATPSAELAAAVERGDASVDLTYRIPPAAGAAAVELGQLLDEADQFCRSGDHLLTLAAPEPVVRYRRWFLGEFTRQCAGEPPTPWSPVVGPSAG